MKNNTAIIIKAIGAKNGKAAKIPATRTDIIIILYIIVPPVRSKNIVKNANTYQSV